LATCSTAARILRRETLPGLPRDLSIRLAIRLRLE
jgi:hypothetical protein